MSQMFLELQPKIKNYLLEEYNQKVLARITVAILRNLENKLPTGNIRKLLMELMLRKFCFQNIM
jgi:hypothetical protein